jgi:hypothetical protein
VENRQKDEHVEEWRQEENKSRSVHKHKWMKAITANRIEGKFGK